MFAENVVSLRCIYTFILLKVGLNQINTKPKTMECGGKNLTVDLTLSIHSGWVLRTASLRDNTKFWNQNEKHRSQFLNLY